jgi:CRISPR-associated protein Csx3
MPKNSLSPEATIDVRVLYDKSAKLDELAQYVAKAQELGGGGKVVVLTGQGPIWLYLKIAHALHGKAKKLIYRSPVTGDVVIFDHDPF